MQVWRNDRFGRGGDHTEFLNAGFPAVRFSVAVENYNWQHQDLRTEKGIEYGDTIDKMDFPYLAKVTKLNVAALAALASAPPPPEPKVEGAVSTDTTVEWAKVSRRRRLHHPLAPDRRQSVAATAQVPLETGHVAVESPRCTTAQSCDDAASSTSASTIGCSASRRSARTAWKARSPRPSPAARSSPM